MKKTIIFDFDGTLVDSFDLFVEASYQATGIKDRLTAVEVTRLRGLPPLTILKQLHLPLWRLPLIYRKGRKTIARHMSEVKAFEGMVQVIKSLHSRGDKLLVVSTNNTQNIHTFLHAHNLSHDFHGIYGKIGLFGKPKALRKILRHHKADIKNCIYIGDEMRDIEAAHEVGLPCIAVTWGFSPPAALRQLKPEGLATKPADIIPLIDKITAAESAS
jgi:phosphoglycolate phosphatase